MPGQPEQLPPSMLKEEYTMSDEVDITDDPILDDTAKSNAIKQTDSIDRSIPATTDEQDASAQNDISETPPAIAEVPRSTALVKREPPRAWAESAALFARIAEMPWPMLTPSSSAPETTSTPAQESEPVVIPDTQYPVISFDMPLDAPFLSAADEPESFTDESIVDRTPRTHVPLLPPPSAPAKVASIPQPDRVLPDTRHLPLRAVLSLVLLTLFLSSSILLWQNVTATHLYIYTLDTATGQVLGQKDSGGSYEGQTFITAPAQEPGSPSTVFFSIAHTTAASQAEQQVLELQESGTSWQQTSQFSISLTRGSLSITPRGDLVVASANGLQVSTANGQLLWHMPINQPTLGAHAFQPAFDSTALYSVKAAASGLLAAYNLQNGALRWTATIHDTLNYAAPLLLDDTTLYVAGDHAIFALNSSNGSLLWTALHPARTLLLSGSGTHRLLIAASADGLLALNPGNGSLAWSFSGQRGTMTPVGVLSLTPTQFYQASREGNTIYATGIAWKAPEIQEELWLYAVDATTGTVRWARQVGSGLVSADAGRVYAPSLDSVHHLVLLEQQPDGSDLALTAFDASSGAPRWNIHFQNITAASPSPLALTGHALLFSCTQTDSGIALRNMTPLRLALLAMLLLSMLGLLFLLLFPLPARTKQHQQAPGKLYRAFLTPLQRVRHLKRSLRYTVLALSLLLVLIAVALPAFTQLHQTQDSIYQVAAHSGATQWQHAASPSAEILAATAQGSILATTEETNMHRVQAVNASGNTLWQTFASEGTFSLPPAPTQPGTMLLALSGHTPLHYQFAPDDPAYPHALDSLLILSLLNRSTGQPLWQNAIINPDAQQNAVVLGADAHFIYVASMQTNGATNSGGTAVQLLAVDQSSGVVTWRVFGPTEPVNTAHDNGMLLLQGRQIIWQVAGAVYAIDSAMGQIQWRRSFGTDDPRTLLQEERQLVEANGVLLVERSKTIYALDPASGNERWTIPALGSDTLSSTAGIASVGNTLLIYGSDQIEALDLTSQHVIWRKKQSENIHSLALADDGKQIYLVLAAATSGGSGDSSTAQTLLAMNSQTGATRWTWEPSASATFDNMRAGEIVEQQGILLATISFSGSQGTSAGESLYAINAATGATLWQVTGNTISGVQISPDGSIVIFQKT